MKDVKKILSQMTLEEKAGMCSGKDFWTLKEIERLGIPSVMVTDGPHGLRKQGGASDHIGLNESVPATCFPTASALASTWNRDLVFEVGQALGEECLAEDVAVILGPGANIKRSPLCGRNFEYFSEDPYLSGEIASSHINGVQSKGIGTSLKHYVANNQEYRRMFIDSVVDERALHELYLAGFEKAVKQSQPWTVMCSYNKINGIYGCEHHYTLTDHLKEEWGHTGLVVTDWGAMNDRVEALKAGLELEMPGSPNGNTEKIIGAVESGELDEAVLDAAVERILSMIFKAKESLKGDHSYDKAAHHALARKVASEGAVLLKNEGLLPLKSAQKIAIIGRFAKEPRWQGGGSSQMVPTQLDNLYDEMAKLVGEDSLLYADGYTVKGDTPDDLLITNASDVALKSDVVVVVAGLTDLYETEGLDRKHMKMPPGHDALIDAITKVHENVIVVLLNGSPVEMPWIDDIEALLEGYLGGQAGAGGIADILTGKVNPSGKLAETFPIKLEDNPSYGNFPGGPATVEYRESIFVGYRYYDKVAQDVLFPFGYGLSYTSYEYGNLSVEQGETVKVSCEVKNTGSVAGKEIVQVYVHDVESTVFKAPKELKAFAKVELNPGERKTVTMELDRRAFAHFEPCLEKWVVESGAFDILVGASSVDLPLKTTVDIVGDEGLPEKRSDLKTYFDYSKDMSVSQSAFENLLGHPVPANESEKKGYYTINTPIGDMQDSFIGRQLFRMIQKNMAKMVEGQEDTPMALLMDAMAFEMPMRTLLMLGGDGMNRGMLEGLLTMMNGKFFKGLGELIRSRK
jgi:beta-glucosidase